MKKLQTAEELFDDAIVDPALEKNAKAAICEKSQIYGGMYAIAMVCCLVLIFFTGWFRWIAGMFTAFCLGSAWSMRGALAALQDVYRRLGRGDMVLQNHRIMNSISIALNGYAFLAVWAAWPAPLLAVFVAAVINFVHYTGYRGEPKSG